MMTEFFLFLGVLAPFLCFVSSLRTRAKLQNCSHAVSAQVASHRKTSDDDDWDYHVVAGYSWEGKPFRTTVHDLIFHKQEQIEEVYPVGKALTVYIDPENPGFCALDPEGHAAKTAGEPILFLCMGIFLIFVILF